MAPSVNDAIPATPPPPPAEGDSPATSAANDTYVPAAEPAGIPGAPESGSTSEPAAPPLGSPEVSTEPPAPPEHSFASPANPGGFFTNFGGFPTAHGALGGRPSGFAGPPGGFPMGTSLAGDLLDGFSLSASLAGTYDTNPSMGYGSSSGSGSGQGDFFTTLGGSATYRSKASEWTWGANYNGSYSEYFSQSELSGYSQNMGASLDYKSGPLSASLNLGVNFGSGANRYYAAVVNEINYNYGLSASYRISSKTSLNANLSQSFSSASGNGYSNTGDFNLGASAMWRYSPLTEFGPGIRYTSETGGSRQGRTTIGPTLNVNYKLSTKVSMNSQLGMDFAQYENGQSADPTMSASLGLNYQASRLWGMNISLFRDVQADPAIAGEFTEVTSLRVGYNHKILRAALNLGVSYETNTSQVPGGGATGRPDRNYVTFDSSLGMPIFAKTCNASVFFRYSDQSGGTGESWDSFQTGFSLSRSF